MLEHVGDTNFLRMLPRMLQDICRRDIIMEVRETQITAPLTVAFNVTVACKELDSTLMELAHSHGIKEPQRTAATTDLLLWIKSLRRSGDSPMQAAWTQYRENKSDLPVDVPFFVKSYRLG